MKRLHWVRTLTCTLALAMAFAGAVLAAEAAAPGPMVSMWVLWPKAGDEAAFEAGLKAHAAWRKGAGEGWNWRIYQPVVGADLAPYVIRAEGLHWADLDTNEAWTTSHGAVAKYMEQLGAHVARAEHYLGEMDTAHSQWKDNPAYKYFGVTSMVMRPGMYGDLTAAVDKVHKAMVDKKWARSYAIEWRIGGPDTMFLVSPFLSYADMTEPDPPFFKVLADALGSVDAAGATMKQLSGSFSSTDYTVYVIRPDLSTPQ